MARPALGRTRATGNRPVASGLHPRHRARAVKPLRVPLSELATVLTNGFWRATWIHRLLWARSLGWGVGTALIVGVGTVVALWARVNLATNWSGVVTLRENHELVQSGPHRFVRHRIYSGILLMGLGSELLYGEAFGSGLLVFTTAVSICKIRVEEKLISQQFPSQYVEYRKNVEPLVPFLL